MSYDLYLKKKSISLTRHEFFEYFQEREHYTLHGNQDCLQAWYQNENTGVYFSFHYVDMDAAEIEDAEEPQRDVEFNINLFRPHFFGLEAAAELTEFCKQFPVEVLDLQEGERWREYDADVFFASWQQNNIAGAKSFRAFNEKEAEGNKEPLIERLFSRKKDKDLPFTPIKSSVLQKYWDWNCSIQKLYESEFSDVDVYIPVIMFYKADNGEIKPLVLWPNAICTVLPKGVDILLGTGNGKDVRGRIAKAKDRKVIEQHKKAYYSDEYMVILHENPPQELLELFDDKQMGQSDLEKIVSLENAINEEYLQ